MNYIITLVTLVTQSHKQKSPQFSTDFFDITSSLNHSAHWLTLLTLLTKLPHLLYLRVVQLQWCVTTKDFNHYM